MQIPINQISTFDRVRQASRKQVDALIASIGEVGLLNPVTVAATEGGFALVAGMHRLEACRALGWEAVPAIVLDLNEQQRIIAECDENLCASSLTAAERAEFTRRRKAAYEALHPETVNGSNQHTRVRQVGEGSEAPRFTADTAASTGQSERAIQRDAERGEKVCDEALSMIKGTKLDTGAYLDSIKNLEPQDQFTKVVGDLAKADAPKPVKVLAAEKPKREPTGLSNLTREGLEDEVLGLRAELAEVKAKLSEVQDERDDFKAKWKEATSGDLGRALGNCQRKLDVAVGRSREYQAQVKRMEYKLGIAQKRVEELQNTAIEFAA